MRPARIETRNLSASLAQLQLKLRVIARMRYVKIRFGEKRLDSGNFIFRGEDGGLHSFQFSLFFPFQLTRLCGRRLRCRGLYRLNAGHLSFLRPLLKVVIVIPDAIPQDTVAFQYTLPEDDRITYCLLTTRLDAAYPAHGLSQAWGGDARTTPDATATDVADACRERSHTG